MRVNYGIVFVSNKKMVTNGVPCIQELKDVFGSRGAQYLDPDGLAISVGEERRGP